jgi:hypothetical protein
MWYSTFVLTIGIVIGGTLMGFLQARMFTKNRTDLVNSEGSAQPAITDWAVLATGDSGDLEIEKAWLRSVQSIYGLFCQKQHDYGPTNIAVGGLPGIAIRLGDKLSRLWELSGLTVPQKGEDQEPKQALVASETLVDTLQDIADYGIIGTLVLCDVWPRMSPQEVWGAGSKKES